MALLLVSFAAGVLTVLAPCTIALLPVIVGGTLAGGTSTRRAVVVTLALGISVITFTFLLKESTALIAVPQIFWEWFSGGLIFLIGLAMLFPALWDRINFFSKVNRGANVALARGYKRQTFWGDVLVGAALGPVFSSCSPTYFLIIATILPASLAAGSLDLLAYAIGLCGFLLIIALVGQRLTAALDLAASPYGWFRRTIGLLFMILGIAIALGFEQQFELAFANANFFNFSGVEQYLLHETQLGQHVPMPGTTYATSTEPTSTSTAARISAEAALYPPAPEITDPAGFLNTNGKPITLAGYKRKEVVLVDFWDYSCINCEREIPYVEAWWQKYKDEGLVVVGVHTPEFSFEKLQSNVASAMQSLGITYPVVLDNNYGTWNAFGNEYWPQIYLINSDGFVVYSHSGEGDYPQTEAAIQKALAERDANLGLPATIANGSVAPANAVEVNGAELGSPETYFGAARNEYLANGAQGVQGPQTLSFPASISSDALYLGGAWNFSDQYAETSSGSAEYQFTAKNVYFVAAGNPSATVEVLLDGKPIPANESGGDVANGVMTIHADKLYKVAALPDYGTHTLELKVTSGTLDAYTFTFG